MKDSCDRYGFHSLTKQAKNYKNNEISACSDLKLTNIPRSKTGLSDFHLMTLSMKKYVTGNQMSFFNK